MKKKKKRTIQINDDKERKNDDSAIESNKRFTKTKENHEKSPKIVYEETKSIKCINFVCLHMQFFL